MKSIDGLDALVAKALKGVANLTIDSMAHIRDEWEAENEVKINLNIHLVKGDRLDAKYKISVLRAKYDDSDGCSIDPNQLTLWEENEDA
jgi:hypothetical protein